MNSQNRIGVPLRAAMPVTTTFALAPTAVALPPRSAPRARAHHRAEPFAWSGAACTRPATSGAIVATYGMLSTMPDMAAEPNSSTVAASRYRSPNAAVAARPTWSMTPVATRPPTITNRPMKKTRVSHSTSTSRSPTGRRASSTARPAPSNATTAGSMCSTGCSTNPSMTSTSTPRVRRSRRGSRIASRSTSSMTPAARSGSWWNSRRNSHRHSSRRTPTRNKAMGARWTRNALKDRPPRLAMMMFGGSPISVAVPPMFDASASAMR